MIMKLISYRDPKLGVFSNPIFEKNITDEEIKESARRMCANAECPKRIFEYDLYVLGTFDDKTGKYETYEPKFLVSLSEFSHLKEVEENAES